MFAFFPKTCSTSWSSTGSASISDSATVTLVPKRVLAAFLRDPGVCATQIVRAGKWSQDAESRVKA